MALVPAVHTPCPVPPDFDQKAFQQVSVGASTFSSRPAWKSCACGLNGAAFRLAAADDSHERFAAAIARSDAFHPSGPRYAQEEALFSFFVNALSTIECLYFALYNVGACMKPAMFPAATSDDLRRVNIGETARRYKMAYPGTALARTLLRVRDAKELEALRAHRDFLTHRGAPPRRHDLGYVPLGSIVDIGSAKSVTIPKDPKDVPSNWTSELSLDPRITAEPRQWLARTANLLLRAAGAFLHAPQP